MRMNKNNYKQYDTRWAKLGYPKSPYFIKDCGCGEVAICNCIIEIAKYKNETPKTIQPYCKQYAAPNGNGTYFSGIPKMMEHYGMTEVEEHQTMGELWKELAKGGRVAIYLMGNRKGGNKGVHWTSSAHFVCSVDYKVKDGKHYVYVKDSNSTSELRNGWITYEDNMRNDVSRVWSGKLPTAEKKSYKVIDVSDWQGSIDWKKVKADGVVGAIIRYADGDTLDKRFAENMKNAKAAGLHIGSYIFSRAKTKAEAEAEATRLYKACKPYAPDMPLYIDLEARGLEKYADTVAIAFLTKMKALGGRPGIYANYNWWTKYLKKTATEHNNNAFWIAQYNSTMDYKPASRMGMWQYTSSGTVKGISGRVDMDKCYVEYWKTTPKKEPSNGEKIASKGWEYAYHTNTKEAAYPSGKPTAAYKAALDAVFGKDRKWSTPAAKGASCDVFVATCIRAAGIDKSAPRGLGRSYFDKSDKFKRVSVTADTIKDGDIISIVWTNGNPHWCMAYKGKVLEASYNGYYPKTQNCLKSRLSKSGKQSVVVYRAK